MQERRRYVRLNVPLEVSCTIDGKPDICHKSISKNISPSGIRFALKEEVPKDTVLNLDIKIPSKAEAISLKAKVVWIEKESGQEKNVYDLGLEFIHIPEESKSVFFQYLCNLMYDQLKRI